MTPAWLPMYEPLIRAGAAAHGLEPALVAAVIEQESNGGLNPRSGAHDPRQLYRYEPGFWSRYLAGKPAWAPPRGVAVDTWARRVSSSYGLMQVMYPTAREHGLPAPPVAEPESLLQPTLGITLGAKILAAFLRRSSGDWTAALLRWNGGARREYAAEVLARVERFRGLGV